MSSLMTRLRIARIAVRRSAGSISMARSIAWHKPFTS